LENLLQERSLTIKFNNMAKVKISNIVYRLKHDNTLEVPNSQPLIFKGGTEFHIVADVIYMGGYPLPKGLQNFLIKWVTSNPTLFVQDTRIF
jgi:hypothetical protein